MKVTETLEARTQALQQQLDSQRNDFAQKLFEAQQDVSKVGSLARCSFICLQKNQLGKYRSEFQNF